MVKYMRINVCSQIGHCDLRSSSVIQISELDCPASMHKLEPGIMERESSQISRVSLILSSVMPTSTHALETPAPKVTMAELPAPREQSAGAEWINHQLDNSYAWCMVTNTFVHVCKSSHYCNRIILVAHVRELETCINQRGHYLFCIDLVSLWLYAGKQQIQFTSADW